MGEPVRRSPPHLELVDPERVGSAPPPHDLAAERATLSAAMLDGSPHGDGSPSALERALEILDGPDKFFDNANARIFEALQALHREGTPVDATTVGSWLYARDTLQKVGGAPYLMQLCDESPAIGNVAAHAEIVLAGWEDRQLLAAAQLVVAQARRPHEAEGGRDAFRARARASLGAATAPRVQIVGQSIGAVVRDVREHIEQAAASKVPTGVPWGWSALEDLGLIGQGRQEVITGRPGMGKTGFTFQLTRRIVEAEPTHDIGEAVYWWSGEMKPRELVTREAANMVSLHFRDVERGHLNARKWDRFSHALARLRALPIWFDHTPCTPEELAARVRTVKALFERGNARHESEDGKPGKLFPRCRMRVVAIDQLSELKPPTWVSPRVDKRERVGETSKACRTNIAKGLDVATLLLCQLNRPVKGPKAIEPPALHDLRESGAIEEHADGVTAIHRRQYYEKQRTPHEWKNVAEVLRLKGRFGEADDMRLGFYGGRFSNELPPAARGEPHFENDTFEPGDDEE